MACPHCGETVNLPDTGALEKPELPAIPPLEPAVPSSIPSSAPAAVKRRRKSSKEKEPSWDRDPNEKGIGSTTTTTRREPFTEYYKGDVTDPDSAQLKRVRRRKNLTGSQKIGRIVIIGTISVVILATAIAIALLVKEQVKVVVSDDNEQRQLPDKVAELVAQALAAKNDSAILTKDEEVACMSIANGFYNAKTIEEKLNFVRLPKRVKPMIERMAVDPSVSEPVQLGEILLSQKIMDKGRRFITILGTLTGSSRDHQLFAFEQKDDTILMDWEVSSGYQPTPIVEFIAKRVSEPTVFRSKLTLSEYYAGSFRDKERYQSVSLTYPGQEDFKLAGYIDRTKEWAQMLLARLEFEAPSLIVTLSFPKNASSAFEVEITGVVLDSWFY